MGLYFGSTKVRITFNTVICRLNVIPVPPSIKDRGLLSSDNYILTDSNGVILSINRSD